MGTDVHLAIERALAGEPMVWSDQPHAEEAAQHALQAIEWIRRFGAPTHVERGFVYDVRRDQASWGPRRGQPDYGKSPPHTLRGTFDLAWIAEDVAHVVDVKTGKTQNAHLEQLFVHALALSRIVGVRTIRVGFLFTRKTKVLSPAWTELDEDALDAFAGKLHRLVRTLPVAQPALGEGCRWCEVPPSACPAFVEAEEAA